MKRRTPSLTMTSSSKTASELPATVSRTRFFTKNNNANNATSTAPSSVRIRLDDPSYANDSSSAVFDDALEEETEEHRDGFNYALLIVLYTLQGIPMGLSASIPFLIQQKMRLLASSTAQHIVAETVVSSVQAAHHASAGGTAAAATAARLSYNANAIFALCSWPFSLKLLWAPIVDACFLRSFGRRKSWIVPVQSLAGMLMVLGANFVERQLGLGVGHTLGESINVNGLTAFFFALYFLMATQDIAVDGWALTMLSKKNRGRGPICNSIGQNIGYFLSFVGFLALNDTESSEALWRPLLGLASNPERGLVSLGSFIRSMGYFMLITTTAVALFKKEVPLSPPAEDSYRTRLVVNKKIDDDDDKELDASEIGLKETYHRLWAVCKLPSVRWLFLILLTYRLPTSLSDNVKFLKAVEYGLSKSTTAVSAMHLVQVGDDFAWVQLVSFHGCLYFFSFSALVSDSDSSLGYHGTDYCDQNMAQFSAATIHDSLQTSRNIGSALGYVDVACFAAWKTNVGIWSNRLLVHHCSVDGLSGYGEQYAVQRANDLFCQARRSSDWRILHDAPQHGGKPRWHVAGIVCHVACECAFEGSPM